MFVQMCRSQPLTSVELLCRGAYDAVFLRLQYVAQLEAALAYVRLTIYDPQESKWGRGQG